MEFKVDKSLQKQFRKECRKIYKGTGYVWICEKALLLLTIVSIIWYIINFVLSGDEIIYTNYLGYRSLNDVFFTEVVLLRAVPGFMFAFFTAVFRKCWERQHSTGGRVGEHIDIMDDKLFYTSQLTAETGGVAHLVIMDLRTTTKIIYDEKRRIMFLQGKMLEYSEVIRDKKEITYNENEMVQTMLELVDCFTPSLHEYLRSYLPEEIVEYHQELPIEKLKELKRKVLLGE